MADVICTKAEDCKIPECDGLQPHERRDTCEHGCDYVEDGAPPAICLPVPTDHDQRNDEAAAKWKGEAEAADLDIALGGQRWHQRARTLNHESAVRIAEKDALESDHAEVIIISTVKGHAVGPVGSHTVYYR